MSRWQIWSDTVPEARIKMISRENALCLGEKASAGVESSYGFWYRHAWSDL
jgi:hypothetical protein